MTRMLKFICKKHLHFYDENIVDELCDEGKLSRNYCVNCGSRNNNPLSKFAKPCSPTCFDSKCPSQHHHQICPNIAIASVCHTIS